MSKKTRRRKITSIDQLFERFIQDGSDEEAFDLLERSEISKKVLEATLQKFLQKGEIDSYEIKTLLRRIKRKLTAKDALIAVRALLDRPHHSDISDVIRTIKKFKLPMKLLDKLIPTNKKILGFDNIEYAVAIAPYVKLDRVKKAIRIALLPEKIEGSEHGPSPGIASRLAKAVGEEIPKDAAVNAIKWAINQGWGMTSVLEWLKILQIEQVGDFIIRYYLGKTASPHNLISFAELGASPETHQTLVTALIDAGVRPQLLLDYSIKVKSSLDDETVESVLQHIRDHLAPPLAS